MLPLLTLLALPAHAAPAPATCADLEASVLDALDTPCEHCLTPTLMGLRAEAEAAGEQACLDDFLIDVGLAPKPVFFGEEPPPDEGDEKATRFQFGAESAYETENFVIRWGTANISDAEASGLGDLMERAWEVEVGEMGYPGPIGSDAYKINVYIGDTGGNAPSAQGNGGYYTRDRTGVPFMVINRDYVQGESDRAPLTTAHEFFHAVQDAVSTYPYSGQGAWLWEASATWIPTEVHDNMTQHPAFLFAVAARPDLPVNHFDYPDQGIIEEYHQYGAFVFVQHLADNHGGPELIQRMWMEDFDTTDPLVAADALLAENGESLQESVFDFNRKAATWDFPEGELYEMWIDSYLGEWRPGDASTRVQATITTADGRAWTPNGNLPRTLGSNLWALYNMPDALEIVVTPDEDLPSWDVTLVSETSDGPVYTIAEPDENGDLVLALEPTPDANLHWVVVSVDDGPVDRGYGYGYTLIVNEIEPEPVDPDPQDPTGEEPTGGCGCTSTGGGAGGLALLLALPLLVWRRRR